MDRVIYIGKFQPFHKGHIKVVKKLRKKHDELIIAIGGAGKSHQTENPFTAGERIEMIRNTVDTNNSLYIVPIPDINSNKVWPSHVIKYTPEFDTIYSNNPLVRQLFNEFNKQTVESINMFDRNNLSGTNVRNKIIKGDDEWKELVPDPVEKKILELNGVNRLQTINMDDIDVNK